MCVLISIIDIVRFDLMTLKTAMELGTLNIYMTT